MRSLRIVLVMIEPPLPFGNAAARWFYVLLKGLVERGHAVTAFAACDTQEEIQRAKELFPAPDYDLRCYRFPKRAGIKAKMETLRQPYSYMFGADLRQDLAETLSHPYDVLHLEQLWSGWAAPPVHRSRALLNLHYLFQIDRSDEHPDSLMERARMIRTRQSENYLLRQHPYLCTLSPRLSDYARRISPAAEIYTLPLGVDLSRYPFTVDSAAEPVVSLIGSFGWRPSYTAGKRLLERLWPEIRKRVPEARLQIVGRQALTVFGEYANQPSVSIHQDVPDTLPYFRQARVLLYAPGRGSGMKVKVLEAFALGVPVVTTAEGVEGIPALDGLHAGVCEDDAGLIDRTVELLNNVQARGQQARAARALMEQHCAPGAVLDRLESIYSGLLERRHKSVA